MGTVVVSVVDAEVGVFISVVGCGLVRLNSVDWWRGVAPCSQACIFIGIVIEFCSCIFFGFSVWSQLVIEKASI